MGQMRLAFPRGARTKITCGHDTHYAKGMCLRCYFRQYRYDHPVERAMAEAKSYAKRMAR